MAKRLVGEYSHSLDAKGRVSVPARFRDILGDEFYVTTGQAGCLILYSSDDFDAFLEKLDEVPDTTDMELAKFKRFFTSSAIYVEVDKLGRILIPPKHREFAGLVKDVEFVGMGKKAEIWSSEKYQEYKDSLDMGSVSSYAKESGMAF